METEAGIPVIDSLDLDDHRWCEYRKQDPFLWDWHDPYDDIVTIYYGARGGGKTSNACWVAMVDGQWRGIPCISNQPFAWIAHDIYGHKYIVKNIPFDREKFILGDPSLKYKRLLIDEGNYELDRLRSNSNKNLSMTDILQQARKFRMCINFCTINYAWLDPRVTGSLVDLQIECSDLYHKPGAKEEGVTKGTMSRGDVYDMSGKKTGYAGRYWFSYMFKMQAMRGIFDTEHFVSNIEARRPVKYGGTPMLIGGDGATYDKGEWLTEKKAQLQMMAEERGKWDDEELWETLGIEGQGLRVTLGKMMSKWGIYRGQKYTGQGFYNLDNMEGAKIGVTLSR